MQNLIIYLAVLMIIILIIMLAKAYKKVNKLTDSFNQKVKELDAEDNTINSQKAELANRKDEIEKKKKEIQCTSLLLGAVYRGYLRLSCLLLILH